MAIAKTKICIGLVGPPKKLDLCVYKGIIKYNKIWK